MEYIDIYDDMMTLIGAMPSEEAHLAGAWHKVIHFWIIRNDNEGQYLVFQKRSSTKVSYPSLFDITSAGHYRTGETVLNGMREVKEELGLDVQNDGLVYLGVRIDLLKGEKMSNREFCETFLYHDNRPIDSYEIDGDEVVGMIQINIDDGLKLFSNDIDSIDVWGYEYNFHTKIKEPKRYTITRDSFVKRLDSYYGKMLMIAKSYFDGYRKLFI